MQLTYKTYARSICAEYCTKCPSFVQLKVLWHILYWFSCGKNISQLHIQFVLYPTFQTFSERRLLRNRSIYDSELKVFDRWYWKKSRISSYDSVCYRIYFADSTVERYIDKKLYKTRFPNNLVSSIILGEIISLSLLLFSSSLEFLQLTSARRAHFNSRTIR